MIIILPSHPPDKLKGFSQRRWGVISLELLLSLQDFRFLLLPENEVASAVDIRMYSNLGFRETLEKRVLTATYLSPFLVTWERKGERWVRKTP